MPIQAWNNQGYRPHKTKITDENAGGTTIGKNAEITQFTRKNSEQKHHEDNNKQYKSNHTGVYIAPFKLAICVFKIRSKYKLKIHIQDERKYPGLDKWYIYYFLIA